LKATTVKPVWAWAIIRWEKYRESLVANSHPRCRRDKRFQNLTRNEYEESKKLLPPRWRKELPSYEDLPRGVIIGVVDLVDCVTESKSPSFMGDYGFVLKNQRPVKPIPCAGAQLLEPATGNRT
jgi:hypothetical protein